MRPGDWFLVLFIVTAVYVLVRPSSKAADLVTALGTLGTAMVKRATDIGN